MTAAVTAAVRPVTAAVTAAVTYTVTAAVTRRQIDALIDKEYMERDGDVYRYLP